MQITPKEVVLEGPPGDWTEEEVLKAIRVAARSVEVLTKDLICQRTIEETLLSLDGRVETRLFPAYDLVFEGKNIDGDHQNGLFELRAHSLPRELSFSYRVGYLPNQYPAIAVMAIKNMGRFILCGDQNYLAEAMSALAVIRSNREKLVSRRVHWAPSSLSGHWLRPG